MQVQQKEGKVATRTVCLLALVGMIYNWHPEPLSYTIYFRGEKVVLKD